MSILDATGKSWWPSVWLGNEWPKVGSYGDLTPISTPDHHFHFTISTYVSSPDQQFLNYTQISISSQFPSGSRTVPNFETSVLSMSVVAYNFFPSSNCLNVLLICFLYWSLKLNVVLVSVTQGWWHSPVVIRRRVLWHCMPVRTLRFRVQNKDFSFSNQRSCCRLRVSTGAHPPGSQPLCSWHVV